MGRKPLRRTISKQVQGQYHTRTHAYTHAHIRAHTHTHKEGSRRMGGNKLNKRLNCLGMVSKRVSQHLKSAHTPISGDARAHIIQLA